MKRIISIILTISVIVLAMAFSTIGANARYYTYDYEDEFWQYVKEEENYQHIIGGKEVYQEYYSYYSEDNDTDTPDWVFGYAMLPFVSPGYCCRYLGDYFLYTDGYLEPFQLGLFVYVPQENKFYDIQDAWKMDFEGLDMVLDMCVDEGVYGVHILGDADADKVLSVMDATQIQLELAGLSKIKCDFKLIENFNRDDWNVSILDATAIQMHLAGLDVTA